MQLSYVFFSRFSKFPGFNDTAKAHVGEVTSVKASVRSAQLSTLLKLIIITVRHQTVVGLESLLGISVLNSVLYCAIYRLLLLAYKV